MCNRRRAVSPINSAAENSIPSPPVWSPLYPVSPRPIQTDTRAGHQLEPVPEIESGEATPRPGQQRTIEAPPLERTVVRSTTANPFASAPHAPMATAPKGSLVLGETVVPELPHKGLVAGQEESDRGAVQEATPQTSKATASSEHAYSGENQDAPFIHRLDGTPAAQADGEAAQIPTQGDVIVAHDPDGNPQDSIHRQTSEAGSRTSRRVTINDQPQSAPPSRQGSEGALGSVRRFAKAFTLPALRRSGPSTASPGKEDSPEGQFEVSQDPPDATTADTNNTPSRKDSAFTLGSNKGVMKSSTPRSVGPETPPPYAAMNEHHDPSLGIPTAREWTTALSDVLPEREDYQALVVEPHQPASVGHQQRPENIIASVDGSSTSRIPSELGHESTPQTPGVIPTFGNHAELLIVNTKPRRLDRVRYYSPKWIVKASMGRRAANEVCFKIRAAQAGIRLEVAR